MSVLSERDVESIVTRYFINGERTEDLVQLSPPALDVDISVIDLILDQELPEQEFVVFRHFSEPKTTVLDVGANFGYSATAIWHVGSKASVVSFEPIEGYGPILSELGVRVNPRTWWARRSKPKKYEHYTLGISDRDGELTFHTAVLDGRIHSALTTADTRIDLAAYVRNTLYWAKVNLGDLHSLKIYSFTSPVTTIDNWMASGVSEVNLRKVVAMKIDTEGYEGHVLVGASKLLRTQKPLILAECGHVTEFTIKTVFDHGYVFAGRDGDQLYVSEGPVQGVNGFFLHPDNIAYYKQIGLMKA